MKRLTQREASVFVLDEFGHELGLRFRRGGGAALDADEYAEFVAVLRALAVHDAVTAVATAMAHDRRVRRTGGGREGAPSRDWLRNELRDLREVLTNVRGFDERRSARTIAMLRPRHARGVVDVPRDTAAWRRAHAMAREAHRRLARRRRWPVRHAHASKNVARYTRTTAVTDMMRFMLRACTDASRRSRRSTRSLLALAIQVSTLEPSRVCGAA
jgi:hypothetical protein